jgi:hypothetical protein
MATTSPTPPPLPNYLDWATWQLADTQLRKLKFKVTQGERYHLYCMHTLFFPAIISTLKQRLRSQYGSHVTVSADCFWIDGRPQAHWDHGGAVLNVELADLLVDVTVYGSGMRTARRAMLVQGKWTDQCEDLGAEACHQGQDDSTNRERDLLEVHCGEIRLFASSSTATPIPAAHANTFDVRKMLLTRS